MDDPVFAAIKQQCERTPVFFSTDYQLSINSDFYISELRAVLRSLRDVAEGPDEVHNIMLKRLSPAVTSTLLQAFNNLWHVGQFPYSWRQAIVITILKKANRAITRRTMAQYR